MSCDKKGRLRVRIQRRDKKGRRRERLEKLNDE
jgi:hypothetical protein